VGAYTAKVVEWQLRNPEGTQEDCIAYVKGLVAEAQ
jgi:hypothetical protein